MVVVVVVGRATARPGAGEMAVGAPRRRRARAIKWTGTGGRAYGRIASQGSAGVVYGERAVE